MMPLSIGQSLRVSAGADRKTAISARGGSSSGSATSAALAASAIAAMRPSRPHPRWAEAASAVLEPNYPGSTTSGNSSRGGGGYRVMPTSSSPRPRRSTYQRSNSVQHQPQLLHQNSQQQTQQPQLHQVQLHHHPSAAVHRATIRGSGSSSLSTAQEQRQLQFRSSVFPVINYHNNNLAWLVACCYKSICASSVIPGLLVS